MLPMYLQKTPTSTDVPDSDIYSLVRPKHDRWGYSARPWHYAIPDINHPVMGDNAVRAHYLIWSQRPYYLTEVFFPKEHTLFLGYTLIFLSVFTIYLLFRKKLSENKSLYAKLFLAIGITAFIFSMPPYVNLKGFRLYFPSEFMYEILPQFRAFARFGILVFISNVALATISLGYIFSKIKSTIQRNTVLTIFLFAIMFEFMFIPPLHAISTKPTPPYLWLAEQSEDFGYLELPRRLDYTDKLYQPIHNKKLLNPYLSTSGLVSKIESSLWWEDPSSSDQHWCVNFVAEGGKYILYHEKETNKQKYLDKFLEENIVSQELKVAIAEIWGNPVWGNHVEKTEEDIFLDTRTNEMKEILISDPKFKLVKEFTNEEIIASRENKNFSADKFDAVSIFEIDMDYCGSINNNE